MWDTPLFISQAFHFFEKYLPRYYKELARMRVLPVFCVQDVRKILFQWQLSSLTYLSYGSSPDFASNFRRIKFYSS